MAFTRVWVMGVLAALGLASQAATAQAVPVPADLAGWQGWVLQGEEYRRCPFLANATPGDASACRCAWPGMLSVAVTSSSGRFTQDWQLWSDSWVRLPGSLEHWPRNVRVNGKAGAVVTRDGVPQLRLGVGRHAVSGDFVWSTRPEALPLDPRTALVSLSVDGAAIAQPERPDGNLWFGRRKLAEQPATLELQVYRLLSDKVPAQLTTRLRLQVAGEPREEFFSRALPDGFTPLALTGDLPARLEPDGRLRVQVRPGAFDLVLTARGNSVATEHAMPAVQGRWPKEEVWSFASDDRLRVAAAEGVAGIDPAQANVPEEWRGLPAFRMTPDAKLAIVERSRGLANADDNALTLSRQLWLDFDHGGFTAVDQIAGTMRRDWRLDMQQPFRLESARRDEESLLVTTGGAPDRVGVELRTPQVRMTAVARTALAGGAMPATGWATRFDAVEGRLNLPPGHRLLAAPGADEAPGAWLDNWGLWNAFGVLLIVVFTYWSAGRVAAAIALVALALTYQEAPEFIWLWGNLLAAIAIARAAPEGRFSRIAARYRLASFVVLGLALLPFAFQQVRLALHPQLEPTTLWAASPAGNVTQQDEAMDQAVVTATMEAAPPDVAMEAGAPVEMRDKMRRNVLAAPEPDYVSGSAGLNVLQKLQRYAPGTLIQAGPGIPAWQYNSYSYRWSGPVEAEQTVRFLYIGPVTLFFWRVAGVIGLAVLFAWLLRSSYGTTWRLPPAFGPATSAALVVLSLALFTPQPAAAASTPDPALLQELKTRLTAPPPCTPTCAELAYAEVTVDGDRLSVRLEASALAPVAFAIPHASDRWQIGAISVDGRSAVAVGREGDASLWLPLEPGAHDIRLTGALAAAESVQLVFPQPPRTVRVEAQGWGVGGVNDGRLLAGTLELTRERSAAAAGVKARTLESATEFPAFIVVQRTFNLDLDWTIDTQILRVAPERAAITVEVPLVANESVLTEGIEVRDGRSVLIGLAPGQVTAQWRSGLARSQTLELGLPADAPRSEVWNFSVNPQLLVEFAGFPAVLPAVVDEANWLFQFYPRPGETLKVNVTRPRPAEGRSFAIDSVAQRTVVGKRSSDTTLSFRYRSTQGARHAIALPADARVTNVSLDGVEVPLRPEGGELSIALLPGEHEVMVGWQSSDGEAFRLQPPAVDLRAPASNIETTLELPQTRWPLYAFGSGVGPAVLYWNELLVFLIVAWLLGRFPQSPLRFHEWLLLGAGLSTLSWSVFATMVLWLFAFRWRAQWSGDPVAWRFNFMQVVLAVLTVVAISSLLFSGIRYGLLASPEMGVTGPGSGGNTFRWFSDQIDSALPQPTVLAAPLWLYRTLMFAWALWIAIALVRWLKWAFTAWTSQGFWRGKVLAQPSAGA